jgi:hypothetical protein
MAHTTSGYMVYTAYTFKTYSQNDIFGVRQILLDNGAFLYFMVLLNGATTVILKEFHPDFSRLGNYRKT